MRHIQVWILGLLLFLATPVVTYAHVLKTDGSVGAIVHVSPEDDPIAREATDFFFEFKDREGKFNPENCDCQGIILQGGKQIYSAPLFQSSTNPSLENASFSFTFPQKDIYKVRVSGKPTTPEAFQSFTLEWDIRVERESDTTPATDTTQDTTQIYRYIPYVITTFLILLFVVFYFIKQRPRR